MTEQEKPPHNPRVHWIVPKLAEEGQPPELPLTIAEARERQQWLRALRRADERAEEAR